MAAGRLRGARRGGNAVEFALLLPVWVLIIGATMDFGWLFYHQAVLDSATTIGCRRGALLDPGDADEHITEILDATTVRMEAVLAAFGMDHPGEFTVNAYTIGEPPARSLVCEVGCRVEPLTGLVTTSRTLRANQLSRLEWQREAAP